MNSNQQRETYLNLTIDTGASLTKACYTIGTNIQDEFDTDKIYFMKMGSEMISVPSKMIEADKLSLQKDQPEDAAWIKLKAKDVNATTFGLLAKKFQAMKQLQIYSVKYENALEKCLAFIGAIISKHKLDKTNIKVIVNLLIPYDEHNSSSLIENDLKNKIKSYYFQGDRITAQLVRFKCFPEGFGGYANRVATNGENWAKDRIISVLMIGHRNCTILVFEKGKLLKADTIRVGFFDLIKNIQRYTINQSIDELEYIIPMVHYNPKKSSQILSSLVRGNSAKNRKAELEMINLAIENSKEMLWNKLVNWLNSHVPNRLNELMIFGGVSLYFRENFENLFSWINIYWGGDVIKEINELFDFNNEPNGHLSLRTIDVYGLHKSLKNRS